MYALGEGVPEDYVRAYAWFNLAAAGGHEKAKELRNEMARTYDPRPDRRSAGAFAELYDRINATDPARWWHGPFPALVAQGATAVNLPRDRMKEQGKW